MSTDAHLSQAGPAQGNAARELLSALWRGKLTILLVFALVTGAVAFGTLRTPPLFEAESSLMVRIGREYVYRPEVGRTESARTPSLTEMVNSEVEILSSRDLAEQVVRQLGVQLMYPDLVDLEPDPQRAAEMAVLRFRQAAAIRPVLESSVIKVGFEHAVPQVAADAVNLLVSRFVDKHVEVFGEERAGRFEKELQERAEVLGNAEEALAEFKRQNGVFDLDEQRSLLLGRRERLDGDLHLLEMELAELRLAAPQQSEPPVLPELPPNLAPEMKDELVRQRYELERDLRALEPEASDRLVENASMRLLDLQLEESRLLRSYSESNRNVQSVRAEIEHVRTFLADAERRAGAYEEVRRHERETRTQELRAEIQRMEEDIQLLVRFEEQSRLLAEREHLAAVEAKRADYERRLTQLDGDIRSLDQQEKSLRQLERARTTAESEVEIYRQRVAEARIGDELDREKRINVRVIEKAAAPVAPNGLPPKMKIALGAFVGLLAGAGLAVLFDLFRTR